jgi:hypothetical protein
MAGDAQVAIGAVLADVPVASLGSGGLAHLVRSVSSAVFLIDVDYYASVGMSIP